VGYRSSNTIAQALLQFGVPEAVCSWAREIDRGLEPVATGLIGQKGGGRSARPELLGGA